MCGRDEGGFYFIDIENKGSVIFIEGLIEYLMFRESAMFPLLAKKLKMCNTTYIVFNPELNYELLVFL